MRDMLTSEGVERSLERRPIVQAPAPTANRNGLTSARHGLEHRAREGVKMVRMVDRSRQQLDAAEMELDAVHDRLGRILPNVQGAATALRTALKSAQAGDAVDDLSAVFGRNTAALDELETVAGNLVAQLLWCRSAWDQYAKTVMASQRLLAEPSHD